MEFRLFIEEDFDKVCELVKEAFDQDFDKPNALSELKELRQNPDYLYLVAVDNDKVVAFCNVFIHRDPFDIPFATLWYFAVDKNVRGKGIGKGMLEFAENECNKRNCSALRLTTNLKNIAMQKASESRNYIKGYCYKKILGEK